MEKKKNLKKKKVDKEKLIKILKMVGYGVALTLCAGAFVTLLVVGVRGCASTPRSIETMSVERSNEISNDRIKRDNVGVDTASYVWLSQYYYDEAPDVNIVSGYVSNGFRVSGSVGGQSFDYVLCSRGMIGSSYANGLTFKKGDGQTTADVIVASYEYHKIGGGLDMLTTTTTNINVGDIITFEKNDSYFDLIKNDNFKNSYNAGFIVDYSNLHMNFNNQINRYAPLGQDNSVFAVGHTTGTHVFFKGLFRDAQGLLYNEMSATYVAGGASQYTTDGSNVYIQPSEPISSMFISLSYRRVLEMSSEGVSTNLLTVNHASYTTVGDKYPVYTNNSTWLSYYFQSIDILYIDNSYDYSGLPTGNYTRLDVLTSLNNTSVVNGGGLSGGGTIGGNSPFSLIGSAFSALLPLFNVYLWPGVTIGLLLVIPLIASIVLFIVWLFKR